MSIYNWKIIVIISYAVHIIRKDTNDIKSACESFQLPINLQNTVSRSSGLSVAVLPCATIVVIINLLSIITAVKVSISGFISISNIFPVFLCSFSATIIG